MGEVFKSAFYDEHVLEGTVEMERDLETQVLVGFRPLTWYNSAIQSASRSSFGQKMFIQLMNKNTNSFKNARKYKNVDVFPLSAYL